jgi:hypothetical protein
MSQTYYTQTITSDGALLALSDATKATAPYITYNCKSPVNLNFLFREVLFCDPESISVNPDDALTGSSKMHVIPTYLNQTVAEAAASADRYADVAATHGHYYSMRLINALMRNELQLSAPEQANLDAYVKHYGGYDDGLISGTSVNTNLASTATMDFGEFFQVALSAVRNKDTNALTTGTKGLVDRENINNAAVADDLNARTVTSVIASDLLETMLYSSNQANTFANGVISNTSAVNWMKQLIYSIIVQSQAANGSVTESEGNERYTPIKRTGVANNEQERFMQLKLQDGDFVVIVFQFTVSKDDGSLINNEQPDNAGIPITIGFKIEHNDSAGDYLSANTGTGGILPIGWENSHESVQAPTNLAASVDPISHNVNVSWTHPDADLSDATMYTVQITDTQSGIIRSQNVLYNAGVNTCIIGPVSPGVHNIDVSVILKYNIGGIISAAPVLLSIPSLAAVPIASGAAAIQADHSIDLTALTPQNKDIFMNKYSIEISSTETVGTNQVYVTNGASSPANINPSNHSLASSNIVIGSQLGTNYTIKVAPVYLVDGIEYVGPFTSYLSNNTALTSGSITGLTFDSSGNLDMTYTDVSVSDKTLLTNYTVEWVNAQIGSSNFGLTAPTAHAIAYGNFTVYGGSYNVSVKQTYTIGGVAFVTNSVTWIVNKPAQPGGPGFNWYNNAVNSDLVIHNFSGYTGTIAVNINGDWRYTAGGSITYNGMANNNYAIDVSFTDGGITSQTHQKWANITWLGSSSG